MRILKDRTEVKQAEWKLPGIDKEKRVGKMEMKVKLVYNDLGGWPLATTHIIGTCQMGE